MNQSILLTDCTARLILDKFENPTIIISSNNSDLIKMSKATGVACPLYIKDDAVFLPIYKSYWNKECKTAKEFYEKHKTMNKLTTISLTLTKFNEKYYFHIKNMIAEYEEKRELTDCDVRLTLDKFNRPTLILKSNHEKLKALNEKLSKGLKYPVLSYNKEKDALFVPIHKLFKGDKSIIVNDDNLLSPSQFYNKYYQMTKINKLTYSNSLFNGKNYIHINSLDIKG